MTRQSASIGEFSFFLSDASRMSNWLQKCMLTLLIVHFTSSVTASFWGWSLFQKEKIIEDVKRMIPSQRMWGKNCGHSLYEFDIMEGYSLNGAVSWKPHKNRFLLVYCMQEMVSNVVQCILNHMLYAGLLNRTLLIAMDPFDNHLEYDYSLMLDVDHFRKCYGKASIMTTNEYKKAYGWKPSVDQIFCWTQREESCPIQSKFDMKEWQNKEPPRAGLLASLERLESVDVPSTVKLHFADLSQHALLPEFLAHYTLANGQILLMGNMLKTGITHEPWLQMSGDLPFSRSPECSTPLAVQPHRAIVKAARNFIANFLNSSGAFSAVHLRRGSNFIKKFCRQTGDCAFPVVQLGECVGNKLAETNISTVFIATDGTTREVEQFKRQLRETISREINFVSLTDYALDTNGWASPLLTINAVKESNQQVNDPLIMLTLDKVICAYSSIFLGSTRSMFSMDIERLRYGFGTAMCEDQFMCDSELPWSVNDFRVKQFESQQ